VFYFRSGCLSDWLKNLLTSGHSISIMDTTIIIISTILSIAFHEFGHAIAAARSLCLAFSFLFFSVRCVCCAQLILKASVLCFTLPAHE